MCQDSTTGRPSLRIFEGLSGWRAECFKGCSCDEILAHFGTTWALFNGRVGRDSVAPVHHVGSCKPVEFVPKLDFAARHSRYVSEISEEQRQWLANHLGVAVEAVRELEIGWDDFDRSYAIPERVADGAVIGIQNRSRDDKKRQQSGTARGLALLPDWQGPFSGGVVPVAEGASDTLALLSMGFRSAIGRPSNCGGADLLADLLIDTPDDVKILILGENDQRHVDGHEQCDGCVACFPGKAGAFLVATKLAAQLERPVCMAMPGDSAKDVRSWLIQTGLNFADAGEVWLDSLDIRTIDPPAVEAKLETDEQAAPVEERPHEQRRPEMVTTRIASLKVPGDYSDRSGTGSGKTSAIVTAMDHGTRHIPGFRAVICMQTHNQCGEVLKELHKVGVDAACYPGRFTGDRTDDDGIVTPANCSNQEADTAQKIGLSAAKSVCFSCEDRQRCGNEGYLHQLKVAEAAPVTLATHARAVFTTLPKLTANRSYISIDENPLPVIRPMADVTEAGIDAALAVLSDVTNNQRWLNSLSEEEIDECDADMPVGPASKSSTSNCRRKNNSADRRKAWKGRCLKFAAHVHAMLMHLKSAMAGVETIKEFVPAATMPVPRAFQWLVFTAGKRMPHIRIDEPIWRPLLDLASGQSHAAAIIGRESRTAGNTEPEYTQSLVVTWSNIPPASATNWFDDATLDLPALEMVLGRPVRDMTPSGAAPTIKSAVQYTDIDITRPATPQHIERLIRVIRSLLAFRPEAKRIGLIVHQTHLSAVKKLAKVEPRIAKIAHFGSGEDRSSNRWFVECDLLAIVGTPRVDKSQIRRRLFQVGDLAAATLDPQWVARRWQGLTESGRQVFVKNKGYDNAKWRAAYDAIVRAGLMQAIGRARITLPCGIPVVVFSSQECGLQVSDSCVGVVKSEGAEEKMLRLLARMQVVFTNTSDAHVLGNRSDAETGLTDLSANSLILANRSDARFSDRTNSLIPCTTIAKESKLSSRVARRLLARLESRLLVCRPGGLRGGWSLTDAGHTLAVQGVAETAAIHTQNTETTAVRQKPICGAV